MPRLEWMFLNDKGEVATPSVLAQLDARTKATLRADLPGLAKELKIGGSGVEQVSGTVTLDGTGDPIREFFTTAATSFKANGVSTPIPAFTAVVWRRTSSGSWGYQLVQDAWVTPAATPDTTAPAAGTLSVSVADVKADLTVSGASDDRGYIQFAFSKDNGGTWTSWQDAATYTLTGLTASTAYQFRHRVRDAAGNTVTGTAVSKTTLAKAYAPGDVITSDDFAGDGPLAGRMTTATLGGDALKFSAAGTAQTSGGVAVSGSTAGHAVLPVGRADLEATFTLAALPTTGGISVSLRHTGGHYYQVNIMPGSLRVQRFWPSGGTIVGSMSAAIGPLSVGGTFTLKIVGSTLTMTGTDSAGKAFTRSGTDTDVPGAGGVGVDMGASTGGKIDDLVVIAR